MNGWKFYKTQTSKKWHTIILRKCEMCPNKMQHKLDKQWLFIFLQNVGPILVVSEWDVLLLCRGFAPTYLASVSHLDQRYNSPCEVLPSLGIFIVVVLVNEKKNSFLWNHGVIGDGHNHHKKFTLTRFIYGELSFTKKWTVVWEDSHVWLFLFRAITWEPCHLLLFKLDLICCS